MSKYAKIAVAASMFALAACRPKAPSRYLLQYKSWDDRWYTITIHTNIVEAEKDLASRKINASTAEWRVEPVTD